MAATVFKCQPINIIKIRIINFFYYCQSWKFMFYSRSNNLHNNFFCCFFFFAFLMFSFCIVCDHCTYILLRFPFLIHIQWHLSRLFYLLQFLLTYVSFKDEFPLTFFSKPSEFAFATAYSAFLIQQNGKYLISR